MSTAEHRNRWLFLTWVGRPAWHKGWGTDFTGPLSTPLSPASPRKPRRRRRRSAGGPRAETGSPATAAPISGRPELAYRLDRFAGRFGARAGRRGGPQPQELSPGHHPPAVDLVGRDLAGAAQRAKQRHRQAGQAGGFPEAVREAVRDASQALFTTDAGFTASDAADDAGEEGVGWECCRQWRSPGPRLPESPDPIVPRRASLSRGRQREIVEPSKPANRATRRFDASLSRRS
jgi:hypothetical protein